MGRLLSACVLSGATVALSAVGAQPGDITAAERIEVWLSDAGVRAEYLSQLDLQYIREGWLFGCRLEMDEESRWDDERPSGITKRFAEYSSDDVLLRAGNQYLTLGRGLLLRALEDNDVRVDRDLDGILGAVSWKAGEGRAFFGRPRDDETGLRDVLLFGTDGDIQLSDAVTVGGGYVRNDASGEEAAGSLGRPMEELLGPRVAISTGAVDCYVEAVARIRHGQPGPRGAWEVSHEEDGHAWYGSASSSLARWAFVIEGKDYLHHDVGYANPPTCDNAGKSLNGGFDERGLGMTITASPSPNVAITGASSAAKARSTNDQRVGVDASIRRDWPGKGALMVAGEWADENGLQGHSARKYWGPSLEATRYLTQRVGLSLKGYCLSRTDSLPGYVDRYLEFQGAVTLSHVSIGSATLSGIIATEPIHEFGDQDTWVSLHVRCTPWDNCDLALILGKERGGITCSGGICHYESPFTGLRMQALLRL